MAYDKVVDSTVLDGYFSDIADAIRSKDGTQNTYTPAQMPQAIEDIPSGGGIPQVLLDLMAGTASGSVTINGVERMDYIAIGLGDVTGINPITELHLPDTISMCHGNSNYSRYGGLLDTYHGNAKLQILDIPKCTRLYVNDGDKSNYADKFKNLKTLNAPELTAIRGSLRGCGIEHLNLPKLTSTDQYAFCFSTSLEDVSLPLLTTMQGNMFEGCTALKNLVTGKLTGLGNSAFRNCSVLEGPLDFTGVTVYVWWKYVCAGCTALEQVEFQNSGSLGSYFFQDSGIKALIIRQKNKNGILSLSNINALTNTPIASGTGYIYVPRDRVATYQADTNWSTYSAQFRALEDYTDDGTLTGEFIMPTN